MSRNLTVAALAFCALAVILTAAGSGWTKADPAPNARPGVNNQKNLVVAPATSSKLTQQTGEVSLIGTQQGLAGDPVVDNRAETTNRQGGEDIASATVIPSMPFSDTGHTTGFADNYQEYGCAEHVSDNPDVVYSYTPPEAEFVTINLCNSTYGTNLWVYKTTQDTLHACNRFNMFECTNPRSALTDVPMDSGVTYYIVIDGDWQLPPGFGDYDMQCTSTPQNLGDSASVHPAIADAGNGNMILGYENKVLDTTLLWLGSGDDGASFPLAGSFGGTNGASYPQVDYWGNDTVFVGTQTPHSTSNGGATIYVVRLWNPIDLAAWSSQSWNFGSFGWHDMKMADIAADPSKPFVQLPGESAFGFLSMVHSSTFTNPPLVDAPHIFYEIDTSIAGFATISWLNDINGCASTSADIDKVTLLSYAAYDWFSTTASQWQLVLRRDNFANFKDPTFDGAFTYGLNPGEHSQFPAIAVDNGTIAVVTEFSTDAAPTDHDIICWYGVGGDMTNMLTSVVVATTDDERYPEIAHISGNSFVCTYIVNNELYLTTSDDGGVTWGIPELVSGTDVVVSEYRSTDIAERGSKIAWEYYALPPSDSSIFIHFASTSLIADSDGDGISDDVDNCVAIPNPGQEDADGDGIGDVCDACTDTDGDGFGDPGFPANTCTEDNCPTVSNAGQEDADADGIGDVCDVCTDTDSDGFGNPGFAANTCPDDNCPDDANAGQEDTNADGIGDACCCEIKSGNVDGIDGDDPIISDLTFLVAHLFTGGDVPPCPLEADVDGLGDGTLITDLTYLVNYLFLSGPPPPACP